MQRCRRSAYRKVIEAVSSSQVSRAEGVELVALIEVQRAAVQELRPEAMHREPTPEELAAYAAEQKRRNDIYAKAYERFQAGLLGLATC